jgi:CelD/BcsL family acetyltransferase involved in cellulose biosynthesis
MPAPPASALATVALFDQLEAAEPFWRTLEADQDGGLLTPYQRFGLLGAWYRHAAAHDGARACIAVGLDTERRPLFVAPLAISRESGIRVARFAGGKHVSLNMPLWQRDYAASASSTAASALTEALRTSHAVDLIALDRQPLVWSGIANPLARLPRQKSVNDCPRLILAPDADALDGVSSSTRKRLRKKENKLRTLPGYRFTCAETAADVDRLLEYFFAVKPKRMEAAGLPDVFSDAPTRAFLREACLAGIENGAPAIRLHALECDAEVLAMFSAVVNEDRVSTMFNTYTLSEHAHFSPGLILLRDMIDYYVARGHRAVDFGVGDDEYKRMFCKDDEPLFDSFVPLNTRGTLAASAFSLVGRAKRLIKSTPALKSAAQAIRAKLPG